MKMFLLITTIILVLININARPTEAIRVLNEEQRFIHQDSLLLRSSLQKGNDPNPAPNPDQPSKLSIGNMGFAGHAIACHHHIMRKPIMFGSA
ncbi:hypothetical protein L484_009766 [Morus notabilis]|uniref:Uncharacterized protein n=1 Tax=Morus notabilis TaxID=981085 RepID=W9S9B1_9ROSA|nr:hypothetical protein L484_009766 [Morus notabilis]